MKRRTLLHAAAAAAATPLDAAQLDVLAALPRSPRMPVVFVGHGSPMNAIGDNLWRRAWEKLGAEFGGKYPQPRLVLCVSAHWLTRGWWLTAMPQPKTIHDFGGFPQELFDQQYPAPGDPAAAQAIASSVGTPHIELDKKDWGFDHGAWSVLKPMFPKAQIPVLQLGMDYSRPLSEHLALGRSLAKLRDHGVLLVGSGNVVHNLRASQRGASLMSAYDWALEFDRLAKGWIDRHDTVAATSAYNAGEVWRAAHPTHDHYLPLLYAMGAADPKEVPRHFTEGYQSASISMRSVVWG